MECKRRPQGVGELTGKMLSIEPLKGGRRYGERRKTHGLKPLVTSIVLVHPLSNLGVYPQGSTDCR